MCHSISQDEADLKAPRSAFQKIEDGLKEAIVYAEKAPVIAVLGRFQPLHNGHVDLISAALKGAHKVLILVGSATESRGLDNPFTYAERKALIEEVFPNEVLTGILKVVPARDMKYRDDAWVKNVVDTISEFDYSPMPILLGMEKDAETAYCLSMFEDKLDVRTIPQRKVMDATSIRAELFAEHGDVSIHEKEMHPSVYKFVTEFRNTYDCKRLRLEYASILKQKQINAKIKEINGFEPIYVAVDSLALWIDHWGKPHLQVITRKGEVGKGKFALVGGYVDAGKDTIMSAVKRENLEEAGHNLDGFTLSGVTVFDSPKRSKRGHMITHVHHFFMKSDTPPALIAGDDAETVQWMPLDQVANLQHLFFADHYHIIAKMLPVVERFYNANK